jgi:CyaY protein
MIMTDTQYLDLAELVLNHVEAEVDRLCETTDIDIDARRAGKMVELAFVDGSKIVLNLQPPLHEIWLAARSGGFHFKFDGAQWMSTREGEEFYALLSRCMSEHARVAVTIAHPLHIDKTGVL